MAHSEALLGTPTHWLRTERARRPGVLPTHGVGATLLRIIREQPGIHFRALGRQAGLTSSGQLRHHLDRLADLGAIAEVKDGRFSRFFGGGDEDPDLRQRQARLSRPVPNLIARLLADRPMSRTELRRRLGCADSTLGYHLNRLVQVGDIQRRIGLNGHEYALSDTSIAPPELPWRRPPADPAADGVSTAQALAPLATTNGYANGHPNGHANGVANGQANGHANGHTNGQAPANPGLTPALPTPQAPPTPAALPDPAAAPAPTPAAPAPALPGTAAADPRSFPVGQ